MRTIQYYVLELPLHKHEVDYLHTTKSELNDNHEIVSEQIWYNGNDPYVRVLIRVFMYGGITSDPETL